MTWLRTDDGFPEHPKADALAEYFGENWSLLNLAFALWHHMGCDCAARRTDGAFNAARAFRVMRAPRAAIEKALAGLVRVGLLEKADEGFVFHDWAKYQPTRAQLDAERESKTRRMARWRAGKPAPGDATETEPERDGDGRVDTLPGASETEARRIGDAPVDASTRPSVDGAVEPAPSRPGPSRPIEEKDVEFDADPAPEPGGTPAAGAALSLLPDDAPATSPVAEVFAHWQKATKHPRARLDPKRERVIRAALKHYAVADLCRAITGYAVSPFHQGQNDTATRHDDVTLCLRDAKHIEAGWELAERHAVPVPAASSSPPPADLGGPRPPAAPAPRPQWSPEMREALTRARTGIDRLRGAGAASGEGSEGHA